MHSARGYATSTARTVTAAWVIAATAACGASHAADPATLARPTSQAPSPSTTTSTSPVDAAGAAALTAYRSMWADFAAAGATSDWRSPALAQHTTGTALSTLSRGLYADHYNGLVTKGQPTLNPTVSTVDPQQAPTTVMVTDCGDSTHYLKYRADSGQPADDGPGGHQLINATVKRQIDGSWKVTDFGIQGVGTCG